MFTRSNFELKVGIFIFTGLVILSVIVFSIGNFYSIKKGYTLDILFSFANGISVGAPVRYAGVEVGEVQQIEVYFDEKRNSPMVRIQVWVPENTWINENAVAVINTLGLLGEKYLEITPGTRDARLLEAGDSLRGHDPVSTEELTRETQATLAKVDSMIESMNKILFDDEMFVSLKGAVTNLESLTLEAKDLLAVAKKGNGTIGKLLSDKRIYDNINDLILDIKKHPWKLLYRPKDSRRK